MTVVCRELPAARLSEAFLLLTDEGEVLVELREGQGRGTPLG